MERSENKESYEESHRLLLRTAGEHPVIDRIGLRQVDKR